MRPLVAVVCIVLLAACQSSQSAQSPTPRPSSSPTSAPAPTATAQPLSCRLPTLIDAQPSNGYNFRGGFVSFPGATYAEDPMGVLKPVGDGEVDTVATPLLRGYMFSGPPFYDLAAKRWLPASVGQASPDGRYYVYATPSFGGPSSSVVVVRISTGAERVMTTMRSVFAVADFDGRYAYLTPTGNELIPSGSGLWRFDTSTGSSALLSSQGWVEMVRFPKVWYGRVNPNDGSPPKTSQGGPLFDSLVEVDITNGSVIPWIYAPGSSVSLKGLDGTGHPVVSIANAPAFSDATGKVILLNSPGDPGTQISDGSESLSRMQSDVAGRIWFGSPRGIYLWTSATGLNLEFAASQAIEPAGHCV